MKLFWVREYAMFLARVDFPTRSAPSKTTALGEQGIWRGHCNTAILSQKQLGVNSASERVEQQ